MSPPKKKSKRSPKGMPSSKKQSKGKKEPEEHPSQKSRRVGREFMDAKFTKNMKFLILTLHIVPNNIFWLGGVRCWSEVIGSDAALKNLFAITGHPHDDSYYKTHKEAIDEHFQPHTYSPDLARVLRAPMDQLHPNFLADLRLTRPDLFNGEATANGNSDAEL
jgi:hypothetical protein